MTFTNTQLAHLTELAITAARKAGAIINAHRDRDVEVNHKEAMGSLASQVVTEVDHKAQAAILKVLLPSCEKYDLALLTEESPDDGSRLEKQAFWCIDPMDGTLAFLRNVPGFAVSIGLVAKDATPLIGVVYDPVQDILYQGIKGQGASKNGEPIPVAGPLNLDKPLILRADLSFASHPWLDMTLEWLNQTAEDLGLPCAELVYHIGSVTNACHVLEASNHVYFKYPRLGNNGGSLWDYAATACLYQETGLIASDIEGRPMDLNRPDSTYMNHRGMIYANNTDLAQRIMAFHRQINQQPE